MTQTSIPAGELASLLDQAYDLHARISAHMDTIQAAAAHAAPILPDAWHDLKPAMDAASIACEIMYGIIRKQRVARLADEPVPYTVPDDLELPF